MYLKARGSGLPRVVLRSQEAGVPSRAGTCSHAGQLLLRPIGKIRLAPSIDPTRQTKRRRNAEEALRGTRVTAAPVCRDEFVPPVTINCILPPSCLACPRGPFFIKLLNQIPCRIRWKAKPRYSRQLPLSPYGPRWANRTAQRCVRNSEPWHNSLPPHVPFRNITLLYLPNWPDQPKPIIAIVPWIAVAAVTRR